MQTKGSTFLSPPSPCSRPLACLDAAGFSSRYLWYMCRCMGEGFVYFYLPMPRSETPVCGEIYFLMILGHTNRVGVRVALSRPPSTHATTELRPLSIILYVHPLKLYRENKHSFYRPGSVVCCFGLKSAAKIWLINNVRTATKSELRPRLPAFEETQSDQTRPNGDLGEDFPPSRNAR